MSFMEQKKRKDAISKAQWHDVYRKTFCLYINDSIPNRIEKDVVYLERVEIKELIFKGLKLELQR